MWLLYTDQAPINGNNVICISRSEKKQIIFKCLGDKNFFWLFQSEPDRERAMHSIEKQLKNEQKFRRGTR